MFLDLSKAFDTVNHKILCDKMECYGIRGTTFEWFQSYLNNRSQYVSFDNTTSSNANIKCGVPQGSILGPLLFLLYVNDIVNVSNDLLPILFADDTNIFLEGTDIDEMCTIMNSEIEKLCSWLNVNKLSLNVEKTHYMVFTKRQNLKVNVPLQIMNVNIKQVDCTKFLGVHIDSHLKWSEHIKFIKNKIAKGLGILNKVRKLLTRKTIVTLYNSFILPHLTYCIEVWGATFDCYLEGLNILHKKAIRLITSKPKMTHTAPLFKQLNLLNLSQLYTFAINMFMFKFTYRLLPPVFTDMFVYNSSVHTYQTRQDYLLHVPLSQSVVLSNSIRIKGVTIWNAIHKCVNIECSLACFKRKLKDFLLSHNVNI